MDIEIESKIDSLRSRQKRVQFAFMHLMNGWNENYTDGRENYHANLLVVPVILYPYK